MLLKKMAMHKNGRRMREIVELTDHGLGVSWMSEHCVCSICSSRSSAQLT